MSCYSKFNFGKVSILLFLIGWFSAIQEIRAQSWLTMGQTWEYYVSTVGGPYLSKMVYNSDTIFNGHNCQKIDSYSRHISFDVSGAITNVSTETHNGARYTYNSGDSVFYYIADQDSFFFMFSFDAQPGDSWPLFEQVIQEDGCDSSVVTVDSIGTLQFAGQTLRWLSLHSSGTGNTGLEGRVVENFGAIGHFLLYMDYGCSFNFEVQLYSPKCYYHPQWGEFADLGNTQQEFPFNGPDCDFYDELGFDDPFSQVSFFPQPARNWLNIHLSEPGNFSFTVYDLQGKELKQGPFSGTDYTLDISDLSAGFYFVKLNNGDNVANRKIVVN